MRWFVLAGAALVAACSLLTTLDDLSGEAPPTKDPPDANANDVPDVVGAFDAGSETDARPQDAGCRPPSCCEDGGCVTVLASGQTQPHRVFAGNKRVYWTNIGDGTIGFAPQPGTPGDVFLMADAGALGGFALNATSMNWPRADGILTAALDGGSIRYSFRGIVVSSNLVVTAATAYWLYTNTMRSATIGSGVTSPGTLALPLPSGTGSAAIAINPSLSTIFGGFSAGADTGIYADVSRVTAYLLTHTTTPPHSMAATATDVFWVERRGYVARVPSNLQDAGVSNHVVFSSAPTQPAHLAVDDTHVYWTNEFTGEVNACPLAACPPTGPEVVVRDTAGIFGIAVDDKYVYYTHVGRGLVLAVPKAQRQ